MIDQTEIMEAVKDAIVNSGLFPNVAWPNRDHPQVRPYLFVQVVPGRVDDETLNRTSPNWAGFIMLTVVYALNRFEDPAQTMLKQAADLFPAGVRIAMTSGRKLLPDHAEPVPGYRDGSDYRISARIPAITTT